MHQDNVKIPPREPKMAPTWFNMALGGPAIVPRLPQDGQNCAQDGPKNGLICPEMAPSGPKMDWLASI